MTGRRNKAQLFILVGAALSISAGDAMADPPCGYLKDMGEPNLSNYRNKAANKGGYVFAFRHSNKTNRAPEGLTPDGVDEAVAGHTHLKAVLNTPGGIEIWEMKYPKRQRVTQTRVGIIQGCALNKNNCSKNNVPEFTNKTRTSKFSIKDADFVQSISHGQLGNKNVFVFANSDELDDFNEGGTPKISCLEGIVYEAAIPPGRNAENQTGDNVFKCYRFFPSQWAAKDPKTAALPVWMDKNLKPDKNVSSKCRW